MAVAAWTINIRLITNSNASLAFSRLGNSASGAQTKVQKLQQTLKDLKTVGLAGLVALGLAAGETFATGVKGAAALQDAMVNTAISTGNLGKTFGATMRNMAQFHTLALKMSMTTAQTVDQSMGLLGIMAASGIKPADLPKMAMPIAKYADVMYLGRDHVPFEDSVTTAAKIAHDLQVFDPKTMTSVLNHLYKMGYSSPDSVARIFTQMRYFAPKAISSGISRDDILDLGAWLDRMGLGQGRGGSGLNMLIKNLQAPAGKVKMSNLEALGVYGSDGSSRFVNARTGAVDLMGLMTYIAAQSQTWKTAGRGAEFNRHIARGFDTNAANVLQTLATMGGMEQLRRIKAQQAKMPSLEAAQAQLMGTLNNQTKLLISNFHSLATEIGFTLLPQLTAFVGGLAAATGNMAMWMHNHPHAAKLTGYGLLGLGAAGAWAGLKLGGEYIAHAAPWMLRRGPMRLAAGILGFGLEHGQKSFVGRMTGSLLGGGFREVATQQGLREMVGVGLGAGKKGLLRAALMDIGTVFQLVGRRALITRVGLGLVGEILLKLGLRAIPVVGQILTVIDILTFLGRHSLDIGKIIGEGAHLLVNGLTYAWDGIKTFFGNLVHFILGGPGVWMHGAGGFFSSIGSAFSNFGKGVSQGWRALDAHPGKSKVAHAASGGFTRGDGLAYLHKSEFVVNPPLTRKLEALTRNVARNESSRPVIIKFGDINVNGDQKSAKQIAKEIAGEVAALFAKSGRLDGAGAVISGFGFSPYELAGGMS